jgi:hypothetical protein
MTTITEKSKAEQSIAASQATMRDEITHLEYLVSRRHEWLDVPLNQKRTTYQSVLRDTREMEKALDGLKKELQELEGNN